VIGVFAGGDCVTGAATAVEAIAAGKNAAPAIDRYLKGEELVGDAKPFNIKKGQLNELTDKEEFVQVERRPRRKTPKLRPDERSSNFHEVELGYTEDMAKKEAESCLECDCKVAHDCRLRELATEYKVPSVPVKRERGDLPPEISTSVN